jgi:hypothetical protein
MPGQQPPTTPQTPAPSPQAPSPAPTPQAEIAPFSAEAGGAVGGETVAFAAPGLAPGGYLDNAIPRTMFRLRFDDATNINRPDRAEYFYAAWKELSFHPHGILNHGVFTGVFFDANAQGPVQSPGQINMRELSGYLEYAFSNRFSVFADLPFRFLHFRGIQEGGDETGGGDQNVPPLHEQNEVQFPDNTPGGLSDFEFGFKYALLADPCRYLTFQYRTYAPTGDPRTGLGTGHWSLEPGLLYYKRWDRLVFQGEFLDWIPVGGGPMEGNVLTYGLGLGYDAYRRDSLCVTPIVELVGWTCLGGFESFFTPGANIPTAPGLVVPPGLNRFTPNALPGDHGVISATGDTIVNIKFGVRTYFGNNQDVYVGYGHALTGDRWYKDIVRIEYRFAF